MSAGNEPQWSLHPPTSENIAVFLARQQTEEFSYAEVGASKASQGEAPPGYNLDHNRVLLGRGEADFAAACAALRAWGMFPAPWTKISPENAPIREGQIVAMQANALGFWWLNACRIVYTIDEAVPVRRFGFAYGTLPGHVEQGEERFSVELHAGGAVWYDLRAFSRPRYWPVRMAKPLARRLQKRFVRDSQAAMKQAVRVSATQR